jgi:hypothetical protein
MHIACGPNLVIKVGGRDDSEMFVALAGDPDRTSKRVLHPRRRYPPLHRPLTLRPGPACAAP